MIWWRCLFRPMFDGMDLSIPPMWWQCRVQRHWILAFNSWHSADKLAGRGFLRSVGRSFGGLEFPVAASLASLLALSFSAKSRCPGIQCICKSTIPFDFAMRCWFHCQSCLKRSLCWSQSWCWWSLLVASCMVSSR